MSTIELIALIFSICLFNTISFFIGAKVGQKVVRGETLETPLKSPLQVATEVADTFEQRKIQERDKIIADNIDSYDGTGIGQKDIPVI